MSQDSQKTYRIVELTVWATDQETEQVVDQIAHLLCPDPEHPGPCPIPWGITAREIADDSPEAADLAIQVRHEYP